MTVNDSQGHSPIAILFKHDYAYNRFQLT